MTTQHRDINTGRQLNPDPDLNPERDEVEQDTESTKAPKRELSNMLILRWGGTDRLVIPGISGRQYVFTQGVAQEVEPEDVDGLLAYTMKAGGCCGKPVIITQVLEEV